MLAKYAMKFDVIECSSQGCEIARSKEQNKLSKVRYFSIFTYKLSKTMF